MDAACQRLCEGDMSSLVDIVNAIDARKSHETSRLGSRNLTAVINVIIREGVELKKVRGKESVPPSASAFFALRVLAQLGMRQSEDGLEVQRALLVLGLQRCRDLCLDAYFLLSRHQRYYVIAFVKLLTILYGCTPLDLLRYETSVNMLTGSSATVQAPSEAAAAPPPAEATTRVSSRGATSRSATRNAPSPPPPREAAASSLRPPNIQNRSAVLVSIPGASFDMPLRTTRRYRDLPKRPINAPFAVNPLYEGPLSTGGGSATGDSTAASRSSTPIPLSPEPTPLPRPAAPEVTIPAQFPTPVVLFSSYHGLGCVPRLPTADDLARLDAWRQEKQQQPTAPRDVQKFIIKTGKGTAECGEVGREFGKMRLVALRSSASSPAPEVESHGFLVRNEHTFASTNAATAAYRQQCLRSSLLSQYIEHGKLLSWGSAAKGALGPLRQRRSQGDSDYAQPAAATVPLPVPSFEASAPRGSPALSAKKHSGYTNDGGGGAAGASSKHTGKTGSASGAPPPGNGGVVAPLTSTLSAAPVPNGDIDAAGSAVAYVRGATQAVTSSRSGDADHVYLPTPVYTTVRVANMACGLSITYLVSTDGVLYSCGRGENGQLGIGERSLRYTESGTNRLQRVLLKSDEAITRVAAGTACAVALAGDRALYCWGHNVYGQCLKLPDLSRVLTPVRLKTSKYTVLDICFGQFFGVLLFDDGVMGTWGIASMLGCSVGAKGLEESLAPDQCKCARQVVHLQLGSECKMAAVRAGPWHALSISRQGEVYTWGVGRGGRLGHGTDAAEVKPRLVEGLRSCFVIDASCASAHTAVLTSTGCVYVFGENAEGQLGLRGRTPRRLPVMMPLPGKAVAVACAREHTCVLLEDGDVVACGTYRTCGVGLGYGTHLSAPARILTNHVSLTLQCGHYHSLVGALHRRTALMMVGHSSIEEVSRISSVVVRNGVRCAASGVGFLIVLSENNSLVAIGRGERGQLGIGSCMKPASKDDVTMTPKFTPVHLPKGVVVHHVRCGPDYVVAIDQKGVLYGWGSNEHQKLSQPAQVDYVYTPVPLSGYAKERIVQVACGGSFVVALTAEGEVLAHGEAAYCGLGSASRPRKPSNGRESGGGGSVGTPTRITALHDIVAIAAGRRHAIAMTSSCNVFAWGLGVLGSGASTASTVATTAPVRVALSQNIRTIGCGAQNSFAITEEGELWVWGFNCYGECGVPPRRESAVSSPAAAASHAGPGAAEGTTAAASVIAAPISVARQVRDAAFTSQFGLVVFEDGQVRVSGRVRHGGRKYLIPSFHSSPQPPFSIDVNEPTGRRWPNNDLSMSSGLSKAESAVPSALSAPRPQQQQQRKRSGQEVVDLGDDEEDDADSETASSTHSSDASPLGPPSLLTTGSARLQPTTSHPPASPRKATSATTAETRRLQLRQHTPRDAFDPPHRLSAGAKRAAALPSSEADGGAAASAVLPPVRPASGQQRSLAGAVASLVSPAPASDLLPHAAYDEPGSAEQGEGEDTGRSTPTSDLSATADLYDGENTRSPDVSINRERNFPEVDDGSPLQGPIDVAAPTERRRVSSGGAVPTLPTHSPLLLPQQQPRPPPSTPPPAAISRPASTTAATTTINSDATTAVAKPKKAETAASSSPAAAATEKTVSGGGAAVARDARNTAKQQLASSAAAAASSSPAAEEQQQQQRIFGVRCFPGWEQICTVMEKHRPTAKEVRMAQTGLQVLLHQPRTKENPRFDLS